MTDNTEPTIEPELTLDQELRFNILVPFYGAMEKKRQEDAGKLTKQDASPIYTEAIKKIERVISDQVAKARIDSLDQFSKDFNNYASEHRELFEPEIVGAVWGLLAKQQIPLNGVKNKSQEDK